MSERRLWHLVELRCGRPGCAQHVGDVAETERGAVLILKRNARWVKDEQGRRDTEYGEWEWQPAVAASAVVTLAPPVDIDQWLEARNSGATFPVVLPQCRRHGALPLDFEELDRRIARARRLRQERATDSTVKFALG